MASIGCLACSHGMKGVHPLRLQAPCRMTPERRVGENLYRRGDGTLCYFYTTEDLTQKAAAAGFKAVECKYACTRLINRAKEFEMKRVFVHGVFRKGCDEERNGGL